jgi:hypothetical protein
MEMKPTGEALDSHIRRDINLRGGTRGAMPLPHPSPSCQRIVVYATAAPDVPSDFSCALGFVRRHLGGSGLREVGSGSLSEGFYLIAEVQKPFPMRRDRLDGTWKFTRRG